MMKKITYIILFHLFFCQVYGQSLRAIDSLHKLVGAAKEDTSKVKLLFDLGTKYNTFTSKQRIEYYLEALKLAHKLNYKTGQKKIYPSLILTFYYRNIYDLSMNYCREYMKFLEDNGWKDELNESYKMYGNLLAKEGNITEATKYYHLAKQHYAIKKEEGGYATVMNNLTLMWFEANRLDSAELYCRKALEIFNSKKSYSSIGNSLLGLSEIFEKRGELDKALEKAKESYTTYKGINEKHGMANALFVMGKIDLDRNRNDSALSKFKASLFYSDQISIANLRKDLYENLANTYGSLGKFKEAFEYHKKFKQCYDSIALESQRGKMQEMEIRLDINKKETQLKEQKREIEVKNKQTKYLLAVMAGVIVCLIISFVAYYQKKRSNRIISEQKKLVEEKQQEILASIRYAKRIQTSLLPSEEALSKTINKLNTN